MVSRYMDINFPSTTASEEQLVQLAREQSIEEPVFRLDDGIRSRTDVHA